MESRLIAATNCDLETMIRDEKFRADLYHRINHIHLNLPPLTARQGDIPVLLRHFFKLREVKINGDGAAFDKLCDLLNSHDWPGNVREFAAIIQRLAILSDGKLVRMIEILPDFLQKKPADDNGEQLLNLLRQAGWNRCKVANVLGVSEGTIRNRIKQYNITQN